MKKLFTAILVVSCLGLFSNDTTYYSTLRKSLYQADKSYTVDSYRQLANTCERIIPVVSNEWLPYYYCAYANVHLAYMHTNEDVKTLYCNKAQALLDSAMKIKPADSENYVLQALIYFAKMQVNQMVSGPLYFPKSQEILNKAGLLNPSNPRVYYIMGQSKMNTPKFFGGGPEAAVPCFEKAIKLFEEFHCENNLYPYWGKEHNTILYNKCKEDADNTDTGQ